MALAGAAAAAPGAFGQSRGDTMGAARDLVCQALELLSITSSREQIERALRFLREALDEYPSFGDAYYYRSLCLNRTKQDPAGQERYLNAARGYGSEALRDKRDPFLLAVPNIYENLAEVGQKWALVVGISQFQPEKGAEPLSFAAADAEEFAKVLKDPEVGRFPENQVFTLQNEKAKTSEIRARLNTIARKAKPEDMVVVYISTHGSSRAEDLRQVSYLYTYDTDVTSRDEMFGTGLPMVDISEIVRTRCNALRTVMIFDTCHSGASSPGETLSSENVDRLREGAGRYVLSSCEAEQRSYEAAGHGYFTASLISSLKARKGCIRMNDLYAQVEKQVSDQVKNTLHKAQHPLMFKSEQTAEIVLGTAVGGKNDQCVSKA